jgi:hypothetical protein
MSSAGVRELKGLLLESLQKSLSDDGFILKAPKDSFIRRRGGVTDIFQMVCLDGNPGLRIQPNVAVRIERVEDIFHQTSGFAARDQKDTPTLGGAIGNITKNDNRACEFLLASPTEVAFVAEQVMRVFHDFALPYFERFGTLSAIDAELNTRPTERTPNRVAPWLRCATGIIVARLVGRSDYRQLIETYSDVMTHSDKGFYLKRFRALVQSLDAIGL